MVEYGLVKIHEPYISFDEAEGVLIVAPEAVLHATFLLPENITDEALEDLRWIAAVIPWRNGPRFTSIQLHEGLSGDKEMRVTFSSAFVGGGLVWIEPYFFSGIGPTNVLPNGFFVKSYGNPGIAKVEWREHSQEFNGEVITDKFYGEYVQLHIYTQDMFGQYLRVRLQDLDTISGNDDLNLDSDVSDSTNALEDYFSVQVRLYESVNDPNTKVQKAVINVYLEHRWMRLAGNFGSQYSLKVRPIIASDADGFVTDERGENLKVKKRNGNDIAPDTANKNGNIATVIGDIMTDVAHFKQCRFEKLTKTFAPDKNSPVTLFSVPEELNINIQTHDIGVVATNGNNDQLIIQVGEPNYDCHLLEPHSDTTLIDISELDGHFDDLEITENNTKLSFTPRYPYNYIDPLVHLKFLTNYFPILAAEEEKYKLTVSTCAFEHKVKLSVYPDVAFSYHIHIGEPEDFTDQNKIYYLNIDVKDDMTRGLDAELDWIENHTKQFNQITGLASVGFLNPIIKDLLMDYIRRSANDLAAGFHGYHSFTSPNEATLIDYGKEYEWLPKVLITYGVLVSVIIDALILYLTRGRSAAVKGASMASKAKRAYKTFRKLRRYKKTAEAIASGRLIDPAKPNGRETKFIWPQVSAHRGIGYVNQDDGRVAVELVERLDAAPLFALEHVVKSSLGSLVADFLGITRLFDLGEQAVGVVGHLRTLDSARQDIENATTTPPPESNGQEEEGFSVAKLFRFRDIQNFLDYLEERLHNKLDEKIKDAFGTDAMVELEFTGFYSASYELRVNLLQKMFYLDIFEGTNKMSFVGDKRVTFGRDYGLHASLKLVANSLATQKWSKLNRYVPDFLGVQLDDTRTELELEGELSGSIVFERTFEWGINGSSPTVRDVMIFTGIVGSLYVKIKAEVQDDNDDWEILTDNQVGTIDENDNTERIMVELLPAFTINFGEEPIFEKSKWEYLML